MHIRQHFLPLTAGAIQGLPERVLAPQRVLESIGPVFRGCLLVIAFAYVLRHGEVRQSPPSVLAGNRPVLNAVDAVAEAISR
jgi:hypothetical protein